MALSGYAHTDRRRVQILITVLGKLGQVYHLHPRNIYQIGQGSEPLLVGWHPFQSGTWNNQSELPWIRSISLQPYFQLARLSRESKRLSIITGDKNLGQEVDRDTHLHTLEM